MTLAPGKIYIGRPNRLTVNYNRDGSDVDPDEVTLRIMSPSRTETSYVYDGGDGDVTKTSAGDYYYDVVPDEAGRWFFRWEATGDDTTDATEGDFLVQTSVFYDNLSDYS
jgi:hypothetical protein